MGLGAWLGKHLARRSPSTDAQNAPVDRPRCHDCGVAEGQLHALFCTKERCPWCGGQLASCQCILDVLNLDDEQRKVVAEYVDDSVEPLRGIIKRWEEALEHKGRIPFIVYPNICAKCGALWPELFKVSAEEWNRYVEPDMRKQVLCRSCFDYVKRVIDSSASK
jgi:hypothetical protein